MSTLEKTISMIETLPETDLLKIQDLIQEFFRQREIESTDDAVGRMLKPMSKKAFMQDIETAEKEIAEGNYKKAQEVFDELEQRYNF
ncbi:MAG: hypothetical protein NC092_00740 [Butyrivibrio sp.]|nr:hypothetical protein [Muribaculum sp.]MCM1551198.1 hypothetical protein [Butyrivibrio sp.]